MKIESILRAIQKVVPKTIYKTAQPYYHKGLAYVATKYYKNPSKDIVVIGITGTKGKSTTSQMMYNAIKACGEKVSLLSTINFIIDDEVEPNLFKMTLPGRFFAQKFLRDTVNAGCKYAVIELTSEGARFYRHYGIELDVLVFTNLTPEHIESHGSFEEYKKAKLSLLTALERSPKRPRISVSNIDDPHGPDFLSNKVELKAPYSLDEVKISTNTKDKIEYTYHNETVSLNIPGVFNVYNSLSVLKTVEALDLNLHRAVNGLNDIKLIRGRVERIENNLGITIIVDYAHTVDSLTKLYETFNGRLVAVLGSTGGGRDISKRPALGAVASKYCDVVIVTDEDPYDDNPVQIMSDVASGVKDKTAVIISDRKEAIIKAIKVANRGDTVLITGKGTDPYIMGPNGSKVPWDDAGVVRDILKELE